MSLTTERLHEILSHGLRPISYSGRSMYGTRCIAVADAKMPPLELLATVVGCCGHISEAAEIVRRALSDNWGRGTVLYWPDLLFDDAD